MVSGRDWSGFAKQEVAGRVRDLMLRTQEPSWRITIKSVCLWFSLGTCGSKYMGVFKCELSLRWTSQLGQALLTVL